MGPNVAISGVVDQDVDVAGLPGEPPDVGGVAHVGAEEARHAARGRDRLDGLGAADGVTAVHRHLGAVPSQLERDRVANAGRRAGDQRPLAGEVVVLGSRHLSLRCQAEPGRIM